MKLLLVKFNLKLNSAESQSLPVPRWQCPAILRLLLVNFKFNLKLPVKFNLPVASLSELELETELQVELQP